MSDVWSGGVAFSYFPAASVQGQFGMVTVNGNTVTTSDDFDRLRTQYNQASGPNSPARSSAATTFGSCPQRAILLPLQPRSRQPQMRLLAVACKALSAAVSLSNIQLQRHRGELIGTACSLLGQQGAVKLSFVMSQYFEINNRNPQSCSFSGNATVNSAAPSSASAATLLLPHVSPTLRPHSRPVPRHNGGSGGSSGGGGSSNGGSSGGNNNSNGAVPLIADARVLLGLGYMTAVGFASAFWVLV
ncbi:glycoside hydrolase family protein [Salix suchowensis]|nr:glycoside hydrolase family protein [Salix suchowensis]